MDSKIPAEVERLTTKCRELQLRLRQVSVSHQSLEWRVRRIEDSILFRFLRWLGPKLAAVGFPVPGPVRTDAANHDEYQSWVQETELLNRMKPHPESRQPTISVILDAGQLERVSFERALTSLRQQQYECWELFVCNASSPPWLDAALRDVIPSVQRADSVSSALSQVRGEAILWTNSSVILEPDALRRFAAAFNEGATAVYSDWDHIDPAGRRHSPRFTPELSPELLRQTLYWGSCYLTGAERVREMPWVGLHDMALELAQGRGPISRIPRMLWHSQEPATAPVKMPIRDAGSTARASIIICSRNPGRLSRCLKSLRPTLDARHEIIIVAHDVDLSAVAERFGARVTRYQGPFHFGVMNEQGVRESTGEVLCFLNDDVFPSAPDWLERMLVHAMRPEVGIVGALLLYPDGAIQHAGVLVDRWNPTHIGRFQRESAYWPWLRMTREVSAVTGACMVMRRAIWDEFGGFDLQFPVNYNDTDLCLRVVARGHRIVLETQAVLVHEESRTRVAVVRPEEVDRFQGRWFAVTDRPDPYFNPQLSSEEETIALPAPWTAIR